MTMLAAALAAVLALPASAGTAPTLRFSGTLSDAQGAPLDGSYLLRFSFVDSDGAKPAWSESRYVKSESGRFSTLLGTRQPLPEGVLKGSYRVTVQAPAGTGWTAQPAGGGELERPAVAWSAPAPAAPPAAEPPPAAPSSPAPAEAASRDVRGLERELEASRREREEARKRIEALERAVASPAKAAEAAAQARIYVVQTGDTLRTVAKRTLGDERHWILVYQANADRLQRAGELVPGQKLVIPAAGR